MNIKRACLIGCLWLWGQSCWATIIDFENVAPDGGQTTEWGTTNNFNGFDVYVPHGHYVDSNSPGVLGGTMPDSGSDWLVHDHFGDAANEPVSIQEALGAVFSLISLDVSEWNINLGLGHILTVTGHYSGGGTIVANLLTDDLFGFETFVFGNAWTNLVQLDLIGSSSNIGNCSGFNVCGALGYDNIVVRAVPEPAAIWILGVGILGLVFRKLRQ